MRTQAEYANKRQCSICHDAHYSGNDHLFSDGHERKWDNTPETAINELTDCTNVCHFRGDAQGNYDLHGHGKATNWNGIALNRNCTACHDASQPHQRGSSNYITKYRFPTLDNSWLTPSVFGKPVKSVCAQCHGTKEVHKTSKGDVGCIDCHDQHAKASDNNVMMIRNTNRVAGSVLGVTGVGATPGSEAVLFQKSEKYPGDNTLHYFTNVSYGTGDPTNPGFCDQRACHGAGSNGGVALTPLATYLSSGKHSGGNQSANSDCEACHSHVDTGGSFRAKSSCTTCHGQPPPPGAAGYIPNESLSPHVKHAGASSYGFDCRLCHVNYTDNNFHNTASKTYQSVFFADNVKRGVSSYDNSTRTCTNITCHSDGRGGNPTIAPQWYDNSLGQVTLDCKACHRSDIASGLPMNSGAHTTHLNNGFSCSACHVNTVSDNNYALNASTGLQNHVNGARDVSIKGVYDSDSNPGNNWDNATGTCSNVVCHGGNPVNWTSDIGKVTCEKCHVRTGDVDDFGTGTQASMTGNGITAGVDNAEWMYSGHGRDAGQYDVSLNPAANLRSGGGSGTNKCAFCHNPAVGHDNAANPFRLANFGTFGQGWNGTCYVCHASAAVGNSAPGYAPAADNTGNYVAKTASKKVGSNHYNPGSSSNARHSSTYNGGAFCFDCHDPHGDRVSGSGNIFMIGKRVSMRTDNTYGIPYGGNDNTYRPAPVFTATTSGADFVSTDNAAPYDGLCEVCHDAASGIQHYTRTGRLDAVAHNPTNPCTDCHTHDGGFRGAGGNNIEQFFDNAYRAASASNYNDVSRHPLRSDNVLFDAGQVDCYTCHGASGTAYRNNECLVCHWENRTSGTPAHPNGTFEWATPSAPGTQLAAYPSGSAQTNDTLCLQCHGGGASASLNGVAPINILPAGETWTGGSGHGQTSIKLAKDNLAGPPAYHCADCHYSRGAQSGGQVRDNYPAGFHASMNRKLVRNDNVSSREYPHPSDPAFPTIDARSGRMNNWCSTRCHGVTGAVLNDDNVVDHTWDKIGAESRSPSHTHPSNFLVTPGALYRNATNLPYSEYFSGALPGSGNGVCVTCHNPHGGGDIRDSGGVPVTPIGSKNMLRMSPADNVSSLCKQCHQ
jgi:predicted CxxxxCH...CXXCH cytochrome family protein